MLDAARTITRAMQGALEDPRAGGFFASPAAASASSRPGAPEKPIYENIVAARALHLVSVHAHDASLDGVAERTLRSIGPRAGGAVLALAVQDISLGPVEVSVVGTSDDPRAAALHRAALRVYEPRKAVHFEGPGRYPARGRASVYVCTRTSCSSPIDEPAAVAAAVARASADAGRVACP
jgi:uncharacterized protein YyaL (SSP411 family)